MTIAQHNFSFVTTLVRRECGIVLDDSKHYLVETRLEPVARTKGYGSLDSFLDDVRRNAAGPLGRSVVDALTTNETSFFRDRHPFDALRTGILPDLIEKRSNMRSLRIWCGASSSGQEPYSLAMTIREHFPELGGWNIQITASDISAEMLAKARSGTYTQLEVNRGLSMRTLVRFFEKQGASWVIKPEIRNMVHFRELNLVRTFPPMGPFDLVMLRNVLIYFDLDTKRAIVDRIKKVMAPHAYLMLGSAESALTIDNSLQRTKFGRTSAFQLP